MIVSDAIYQYFLSSFTGVVAAYWIAVDTYRLHKAFKMQPRDLAVRDRIFGSSLGILIGCVGVAGVIMHLVK